MTATEKLRKENQALRKEIQELKNQLKEITDGMSQAQQQSGQKTREMSPGKEHSVEFMSDQFDDFTSFKSAATKQIQQLTKRVEEISIMCDRIAKSLDAFEEYSYQYNVKIVGLPTVTANETSDQTTHLCLKLFSALGVEDVTVSDIDIAHRVPSRTASNRPNAVICKFVRRIAKEKVMAKRNEVSNIAAAALDLPDSVDVTHISVYDHLTPRLQELLYECNRYKRDNNFRFCWAKNGVVYLRKSETSAVVRLKSIMDLQEIRNNEDS